MKKTYTPDKLKFDLEISFAQFGEFVFKEARPKSRKEKPSKQSPLYVFPRSTAALVEL